MYNWLEFVQNTKYYFHHKYLQYIEQTFHYREYEVHYTIYINIRKIYNYKDSVNYYYFFQL